VLVQGESGTGKELVAREIHRLSPRHGKPFITVNCAAIPESLIEAELFGHERGAFTGAVSTRRGLIEQADGGTLFLDEIGDMPPAMQARLLRVLQEREVVRLGSAAAASPNAVDVRVIAATHRNLDSEVTAGRFRLDLLYRLADYRIHVASLRDRPGDPARLAAHFATQLSPAKRLSREARAVLDGHDWPGNVRELRSVIHAAAIDAGGRRIGANHVLAHLPDLEVASRAPALNLADRIVAHLHEVGARTAREITEALGVPKSTLHRALTGMVSAGQIVRQRGDTASTFAIAEPGDDHPAADIPPRLAAGVTLIEKQGRVTRSEYAKLLGVSPRTASRDLAVLLERGLISNDGRNGRDAGYVVSIDS
jgi:transcriptional regulator with GAF, ATPase, and Fis domain